MNLFCETIDETKYTIATYDLAGINSLREAAWNLAVGQSVGNPNVRNEWETDELFANHSCVIEGDEDYLKSVKSGIINIGFPIINTDWEGDGVSHLLCQLMGGQLDIDVITRCRLVDLKIPQSVTDAHFLGPKFGIQGARDFLDVHDKPFLGAIIKPKTGVAPDILLEMTKQLVDGGINFIKEDEILSNPAFCPLQKRIELVSDYLATLSHNVVYAFCINGDPHTVLKRTEQVYQGGGNAVHVNFWSGLGVYNSIRKMDLPLFVHFQKSGDKILTDKSHRFGIDWYVICKLVGIMGSDFIHAGMWGGYCDDDETELARCLEELVSAGVVPALSCGMHPGLVAATRRQFGVDFMANVGGAIHGHPGGTLSGVRAMRQAIDGDHGAEYDAAIAKWGLTE